MTTEQRPVNPSLSSREKRAAFFARMKEKSMQLKQKAIRCGKDLDNKILKNPVKSTIIAGITGLIIGKFLKKK